MRLSTASDRYTWHSDCNQVLHFSGMTCSAGERINKAVRNAQRSKTPVMCIVGEKEVEAQSLTVRLYGEEQDRGSMPTADVISRICDATKVRMPF